MAEQKKIAKGSGGRKKPEPKVKKKSVASEKKTVTKSKPVAKTPKSPVKKGKGTKAAQGIEKKKTAGAVKKTAAKPAAAVDKKIPAKKTKAVKPVKAVSPKSPAAGRKGKTALVTGATAGIGKEAAIELARQGYHLILPVRDQARGSSIAEEIKGLVPGSVIELFQCDLSSLQSIVSFASHVQKKKRVIDLLLNNAGTWNLSREISQEGIEATWAVNVLAPVLLTHLFLPSLRNAPQGRVVNVASALHTGSIDFDDIEKSTGYTGKGVYAQSKLALILLTRYLAAKLGCCGVTVNSVHPGFVATELGRDNMVMNLFFQLFGKSASKGARTLLYASLSTDLDNITGAYLANEKVAEPLPNAQKDEWGKQLYKLVMKYYKKNQLPVKSI